MNRIGLVLLFAVGMAVATVSSLFVCRDRPEPAQRRMGCRFHPISLEGFSCPFAGLGVECESVDVRKRRLGGLVLAGLNVLELKNLRLTLRRKVADPYAADPTAARRLAELPDALAAEQMETLKSMFAPNINVSGLRVDGVTVLRGDKIDAGEVWLRAACVRNSGRRLLISGLMIREDGRDRFVGEARLDIDKGCAIEYGEKYSQRLSVF